METEEPNPKTFELATPLNLETNISPINTSIENSQNNNVNITTTSYLPIANSLSLKKKVISSFSELSLLNKMFFIWTFITMKISNKTSLKVSHLLSYIHLKETRSDLAFLRDIWFGNKEKGIKGYNSLKFCPLLLAIVRANAIYLFGLFCATFLNTGLKFVQIYFLRELIIVFKHLSDPTSKEPKFSLIPSAMFFLFAKVFPVSMIVFVIRLILGSSPVIFS